MTRKEVLDRIQELEQQAQAQGGLNDEERQEYLELTGETE